MEAIVAAKRRVRVRRVERVGGALGASLAFAHQAQDEGGKAGDAGADDAEAGFDAGPDGDVDGETWGGGLVGIVVWGGGRGAYRLCLGERIGRLGLCAWY